MKNAEIKITERKIRKIGLVVNALSPKMGGNSKSAALGGLKPSSASFTLKTDHLFHHPHGRSNDAQPYVQIRNLAKFLLPAKPDPNSSDRSALKSTAQCRPEPKLSQT